MLTAKEQMEMLYWPSPPMVRAVAPAIRKQVSRKFRFDFLKRQQIAVFRSLGAEFLMKVKRSVGLDQHQALHQCLPLAPRDTRPEALVKIIDQYLG
jgi:hypothetical protein